MTPIQSNRIELADVLRGVAILGIVLLHSMEHYNFYRFPEVGRFVQFASTAAWDGTFFAFAGKCYGMFALLFGFSFFIQDRNYKARGGDFRARFAWRLVLLFIIGVVDAAFFTAEIFVMYALIGFVLIPVCRLGNKALLAIAAICFLQPYEIYRMIASLITGVTEPPVPLDAPYWAVVNAAQHGESFIEMIKANLWEGQLASLGWAWENGRIFQTAGLFILGMVAGRMQFFTKNETASRRMILTMLWGLLIFFPMYGLSGMFPKFIDNQVMLKSVMLIVEPLHKMGFMAFLIGTIGWLFFNVKSVGSWLGKLQVYGRMSLTNYFTQSIIGSFLFYGWGLYLNTTPAVSFLIGVAIFIVQYTFCKWWLTSHRQGPMEWLWKKATWIGSSK